MGADIRGAAVDWLSPAHLGYQTAWFKDDLQQFKNVAASDLFEFGNRQ